MNDKTKLYVFTKIEIILIFIFMLLIAPTFLLIGFRWGVGYSYKEAGLTKFENNTLQNLRSQKEENVEKAAQELIKGRPDAELPNDSMKRLQSKIENLDRKEVSPEDSTSDDIANTIEMNTEVDDPFKIKNSVESIKDKYSGKYTIQLASYRKLMDAQTFADGFKIRGYEPIISNAEIASGVWFRVSLGAFETIGQSKEFIKKERELFRGVDDYRIIKFD